MNKKSMRYLDQPRGPNTAYRFKMKTPKALVGFTDPTTSKKFGNWIIRPLDGQRHLPSAKKLRDMRLAEVRAMEAHAAAGRAMSGRFSLENAEAWAEELKAYEDDAAGNKDHQGPNVRELINEEIAKAPKGQRKAFAKIALKQSLSLSEAQRRYLHDRREGNGNGYATLGKTTQNDLDVALRYLAKHSEATLETLFLEDVTKELIADFRGNFLSEQTSPRAPQGLSQATIAKHCGFLKKLWDWAVAHSYAPDTGNPFAPPSGVRRVGRSKAPKRDMFTAKQVTAILAAEPSGERLGDIFRLALVSGCRADEIAKVTVDDVTEDGTFYTIATGKSENAARVVPVPECARPIVIRLRQSAIDAGEARLFHEYPLRPATGKASSLSQHFTRVRRKVLGVETDGRLAFHSLRHTWMTKARQAGVSAGDYNDLGGWAGERTSSSSYDHGLLNADLADRQAKIAARLLTDGYLEGY